jgi:hypothetical protein
VINFYFVIPKTDARIKIRVMAIKCNMYFKINAIIFRVMATFLVLNGNIFRIMLIF